MLTDVFGIPKAITRTFIPPEKPERAGISKHTYHGPSGSRRYLMFTPHRPRKRPGVVLAMHGCGQTAAAFERGSLLSEAAAERGFHVVFPEQPRDQNALRCWNWFLPGNQHRGMGEAALLMDLLDAAASEAGLDDPELFVTGLSAGGAMSTVIAAAYPDRFRAAGVHSGALGYSVSKPADAMSLMKRGPVKAHSLLTPIPMIVFHGDADEMVSPANGEELAGMLGKTGPVYKGEGWQAVKAEKGEYWRVHDLGHAWSGGDGKQRFASSAGPSASREMIRFFDQQAGR